MQVDKYALTKAFNNLILHHNPSPNTTTPPASFVRRVEQCMNRMDPLLKTLQVRSSPPEGLVQAYLIHIADRSDTNFRKILDLKGVRKQDHPHLIELFTIHKESPSTERTLVASSPLLTPLMQSSGMGHTAGMGSISGSSALNAAAPKFETGSLGEKLLSAARDISTATDRAGQQGLEKATINENLRNFGKFFKRDIGGFGARFGKRDGSEEGFR